MGIVSRKIRNSARISKTCLNCEGIFEIPKCRDWREHCCSSVCKKEYRESLLLADRECRRRHCEKCGAEFFPRWTQINAGQGRFCSNGCAMHTTIAAAHTPMANKRRAEAINQAIREGRLVYKSGEENPQWRGGLKATQKRRHESGKAYAYTRKYRKENPDKVREFSRRRSGRKVGRLPWGTIPKIRELQKNKCAICRKSLKGGDHLDHIVPLAKGGKHEPKNLQLLCPSCNVRKSAKHPVDYMQEAGFLL